MKVIETVKKEIDWSKGGQLVVGTTGVFVLTSGDHRGAVFSGANLSSGKPTNGWLNSCFTLVESPVTFVNE